jgi:gibberellin 2-oxidase
MENDVPKIDLSARRSSVSTKIVKACEKYGFFMVTNHDVPLNVVGELEQQGLQFFARPMAEKLRAGPGTPYGYGCNRIGPNGDMGALEYLTLSTNPASPDYIARRARTISNRPSKFS